MVTCRFSTLNSFIKSNRKYKLVSWIGESSFGRGVAPSDFARCDLIQNRQSKIRNRDTPWCNGNTAPFGGVILGSNPSGVATSFVLRFAHAEGFAKSEISEISHEGELLPFDPRKNPMPSP